MKKHIIIDTSRKDSLQIFSALAKSYLFKFTGFKFDQDPKKILYDYQSSEWPLIFYCKSRVPNKNGNYKKFQIRIRCVATKDMPEYIKLSGLSFDTKEFFKVPKDKSYLRISYKEKHKGKSNGTGVSYS